MTPDPPDRAPCARCAGYAPEPPTGCGRLPAVGGLVEAAALVPAGDGEWNGLLFDNPSVGVPPALTWTFRVPLADVDGEPATLDVQWLPVETDGWRTMAGLAASSDAFAEPAEASVRR